MSLIPASRPVYAQAQRSGNRMFLRRNRHLSKEVFVKVVATCLGLPMIVLPAVSGGRADSGEKAREVTTSNEPVTVLGVKLQLEKDSPILEIVSTRPVRPVITNTQDPRVLQIDLNNAQVSVRHKIIAVQSPLISTIHLNQMAGIPPVVSILVHELKPLSYTWDSAGNRLTIRLHLESEEVRAKPPVVASLTRETATVAIPVNSAKNAIFADRLVSGSSFSAGFSTEKLRLARGGEVHVCPGTTVSVIHPPNGGDLLLAMGVGALETHYALENSVDTILTPDFRILLRGPGEFHYAIRADSHGNTCVRALPGNTAPVVVYESIGNGQFEVVPSEQLIFHGGHLSASDTAFHSGKLTEVETVIPDDCGCPQPAPVLLAELPATPVQSENSSPSVSSQPRVEATLTPITVRDVVADPENGHSLPLNAKEKPAEFEASFVFSRREPSPPKLVDLPLSSRQSPLLETTVVAPKLARETDQKIHKGVFKKMAGFFSRMFR
jgi:hypothetical protein